MRIDIFTSNPEKPLRVTMKFKLLWLSLTAVIFLLSLSKVSSEIVIIGNRSACRQPKAPGLCRGRQLRYAYNEDTGNCVSFYYTGCASTANNFLTFEECRRDCMEKLRY